MKTISPLHNLLTTKEQTELLKIKLDIIDPNPEQDRNNWDDPDTIEHISSLSRSIGKMGDVSDPIKIIPNSSEKGRYILVDGECRFRAAKKANLTELTAIIKRDLTVEQASVEALQTQTNKLALRPIAMAKALQKRIDSGWTIQRLKEATGKSDAWLSKRISLLDIPDDVKEIAEDGLVLDPDNLKKIAKLKDKERSDFITNLKNGNASIKDIKKGKVTRPKSATTRKSRITISEEDAKLIIEKHSIIEDTENITIAELWKKFLSDIKNTAND